MSLLDIVVPILGAVGRQITEHYMDQKASKKFTGELQEFMSIYTDYGFLVPVLPSSSHPNSPAGWRTTPDKGQVHFCYMYPEIQGAIEQTGVDQTSLIETLRRPVMVNVNAVNKDSTVRSRLGAGWPSDLKQAILQSEDKNPFVGTGKTMSPNVIGRHCMGIMAKTRSAQEAAGAVILRILGLARVCGVYELGIADLMEIMAHSTIYDRIARSYIASFLGLDADKLYQFGYRLPDGQTVGSKLNNMAVSGMLDPQGLVQVGTINNGRAVLTYPCPVEELEDVRIQVKGEAKSAQNEPIFMDPVLATVLSYRPANKRKRTLTKMFTADLLREVGYSFIPHSLVSKIDAGRQKVLKYDVHGNALWQSQEAEEIRIRIPRSPDDRKLHATITQIGVYHWQWSPGGLLGKPCDCNRPDPNKRFLSRRFQGFPLLDIFSHGLEAESAFTPFESVMLYWVTEDVPLAMFRSPLVMNPYIQSFSECLYCAINRAMAYGCTIVLAGGC